MAYTTIDDPSKHFVTDIYTGTGSSHERTLDFKPDWLWSKARDEAYNHILIDSTRGTNKGIFSDVTNAEATNNNYLSSFNSDGYTLSSIANNNGNETSFVTWAWKANGATTTTNDASSTSVGTIDSVYQANTTAGFSIVTYTGTGSAGSIAHGIGSAPKMVICKKRSDTGEFITWHTGINIQAKLSLNTNDALYNPSSNIYWNGTSPTSTVFSVGTSGSLNANGSTYIAYCFAEKQGYSKFGTYEANNSTDGAFVYTGFQPAWVMVKSVDATGNWFIMDSTRSDINVSNEIIFADLNAAEDTSNAIDFLSNGFKLRNSGSGGLNYQNTYLYMAFAEHPFVSSKGAPVTAR